MFIEFYILCKYDFNLLLSYRHKKTYMVYSLCCEICFVTYCSLDFCEFASDTRKDCVVVLQASDVRFYLFS